MKRALAAWCLVLVAGCAANHAPVVDAPVRDRSAKPAALPKAEPAKPAIAGKPAGAKTDGDWRPDTYTVKKGDTLYGIALDHGQDYRDIAAWNGIADPNVIAVGQTLRVRAPDGAREATADGDGAAVVTRPVAPQPSVDARPLEEAMPVPLKKGPKALKVPYSDKAYAELGGGLDKAAAAPKPTPESKPPGDLKATGDPKSPGDAKPPTDSKQQGDSKPVAAASAPVAVPANLPGPAIKSPPSAGTSAPPNVPAAASASGAPPTPGVSPGTNGKPATQQATAPAVAAGKAGASGWAWPARGKVVHEFGSGPNPKGITVAGQAGEPVVASAAGKVVYSGAGLRGYGKLVIIKHDAQLLSVYAHNRELLVKEGDRVQKGQKIAEMGDSDADSVGLHFEIRRLGKPVDPMPYLQGNG